MRQPLTLALFSIITALLLPACTRHGCKPTGLDDDLNGYMRMRLLKGKEPVLLDAFTTAEVFYPAVRILRMPADTTELVAKNVILVPFSIAHDSLRLRLAGNGREDTVTIAYEKRAAHKPGCDWERMEMYAYNIRVASSTFDSISVTIEPDAENY